MKSFYFVRHGETDWNKDYVFQGPHDIPLNQNGLKQAHIVANRLSNIDFNVIHTSPLLRAHRTAEIILQKKSHIKLINNTDFMECKSEQTARYILNEKGVSPLPSFKKLVPDPESPDSFISRVKNGLTTALSTSQSPLLVAHGGVCWALCHILDLESISTPNCCLLHFKFFRNNYSLSILD